MKVIRRIPAYSRVLVTWFCGFDLIKRLCITHLPDTALCAGEIWIDHIAFYLLSKAQEESEISNTQGHSLVRMRIFILNCDVIEQEENIGEPVGDIIEIFYH